MDTSQLTEFLVFIAIKPGHEDTFRYRTNEPCAAARSAAEPSAAHCRAESAVEWQSAPLAVLVCLEASRISRFASPLLKVCPNDKKSDQTPSSYPSGGRLRRLPSVPHIGDFYPTRVSSSRHPLFMLTAFGHFPLSTGRPRSIEGIVARHSLVTDRIF